MKQTVENMTRAARIAPIWGVYGDEDEDLRTNMVDLLTDLHHLADAEGIDWDAAIRMADIHHEAEVEGE